MLRSLREHWPEYLIEAALQGAFMISAGIFTGLKERAANLNCALPPKTVGFQRSSRGG